MNTKQVLYNALMSQLDLKKDSGTKHDDEVFKPAFDELKFKVKTWFDDNVTSVYKFFEYTGEELSVSTKNDSWGSKIRIKLNYRRDGGVYISFNNSSVDTRNEEEMLYAQVLCSVLNKTKNIESMNEKTWFPTYQELHQKQKTVWDEYNDLKQAVNKLKNEIYSDSLNDMKQIGFELKQFNLAYSIDWDYGGDRQRVYKEVISKKSIRLQYGRSQYDTCYVDGFKVLGKKGNKYHVEVYRDGSIWTYDILEKKFDNFINDVGNWEHEHAPKNKKETEERLAKYNNHE